jgi:DNA-binding MarR family transcriptional regulator
VPTTTDVDPELTKVLDVVLGASRTLVAVSAQSIASVLDQVDVMQFRILVVVASTGPCSLGGVAAAVDLHISTASRTCDRMAAIGLLNRSPSATDRRNLELTLTPEGEAVVGRVLRRRRAALESVLARLGARKRRRLGAALRDFAEAAGEPPDWALWAMGWTTECDKTESDETEQEREVAKR